MAHAQVLPFMVTFSRDFSLMMVKITTFRYYNAGPRKNSTYTNGDNDCTLKNYIINNVMLRTIILQ